MTHRERALMAINHQEPDRVPLDLGGVGGLLVDPVYFEVLKKLGLPADVEPYRAGSTANYYDERILEAFDIDFRHVWLSSPDKPKAIKNPDGTTLDDWGIVWSKEGSYPVFFPFSGKSDEYIMNEYNWPDPHGWDTSALRERARHLYEDTDYCVVAKAVLDGAGILERCYYLRTMDELFVDMLTNEELVDFMVNKIADIEIALWDMYLDAVGPYIHIIQRAMDLGTQHSLFISPELFRRFFKPAEERVYNFIKSKAPQVKIWYHSCGAVAPLIPDLLDLKIDILNNVQPHCDGMDSFELKKQWGDKLCFHGGIDLQKALPGSLEDVRVEVEKRIDAFGPGGGYILAPTNHIQKDTPAENVIFMFQHAKEYGQYPLKGSKK